jgi:predicted enzyme related to lactoylglutathione lyase
MNDNVVGWFEIPVMDMQRAIEFYETVFAFKMHRQKLDGLDMAWFPFDESGTGSSGALVHAPDYYQPSSKGILIYFTARSGDLSEELSRVNDAGGEVIQAKKMISDDIGFMGLFLDSEGNRIALHSRK